MAFYPSLLSLLYGGELGGRKRNGLSGYKPLVMKAHCSGGETSVPTSRFMEDNICGKKYLFAGLVLGGHTGAKGQRVTARQPHRKTEGRRERGKRTECKQLQCRTANPIPGATLSPRSQRPFSALATTQPPTLMAPLGNRESSYQ